jgi:NAD(P)-binding Rossmann-like domain
MLRNKIAAWSVLQLLINVNTQRVLAAPSTQQSSYETFDYVVVGGGPAGLVLAEQLTRHPQVKVLLLEAGPDSSLDPLVSSKCFFNQGRPSDMFLVFNIVGSAGVLFRSIGILLELFLRS